MRKGTLIAKARAALGGLYARLRTPRRLYDISTAGETGQLPGKRALLSYLTAPLLLDASDPRFLHHINVWHVREMVRVLNTIGYVVDVIDYNDTRFVPRRAYDLFVGHGGINFARIAQRLSPSTTKVYWSTGAYWRFHAQQALRRHEWLKERRGVELPLERIIPHEEDSALLAADAVVGIGGEFTRQTYPDPCSVSMLAVTALKDDHVLEERDYQIARQNFLYFAGGGAVHKGLDLLLEAVNGLDQQLWVCGTVGEAFWHEYQSELTERANIHYIGWIQPRSTRFYELVSLCGYAVLPSCSEGMPHSVIECMKYGLIPIVSVFCGLDVKDYGFMLEPCTIDVIRKIVVKASSLDEQTVAGMSQRVLDAVRANHSEEAFALGFQQAIEVAVGKSPGFVVR